MESVKYVLDYLTYLVDFCTSIEYRRTIVLYPDLHMTAQKVA